jgi:PAS domain S-box-containing protein
VIGPRGEFVGLVSAALDPAYFSVLLRSALYAPDMRAGLAHGDGEAFLILSQDTQYQERNLGRPDTFFSRHRESGQTATMLTGISHVSGEERMIAERTMDPAGLHMDKPLIVSVSRAVSAIYAPWRERAIELGGLFGALALMTIVGLYGLQHRHQMADRVAAAREEEWQDGNERLKLALSSADLGLWDWDLPSGKIAFNDRWREMLGYAYGELEPHISTWKKLVHPDDWPVIHEALNAHLAGETKAYEAEYRMRNNDDGWVRVLCRGRVMKRDASGAPARFVATHMAITERNRR